MRKIAMVFSALALGVTMPAMAETTASVAQPAAAAKHFTTQDTTIGELIENAATKTILDKHLPDLSSNPSISMAAGMTLRAIQPMAADKIPVEKLDAIDADLAKLAAK